MTIAIAIKVHDGIVLAADSAVTIPVPMMIKGLSPLGTPEPGPVVMAPGNVYNNANKLFNLIKGQPIGGMCWGSGSIGVASISTLIKDLRKRMKESHPNGGSDPWHIALENYSVESIAQRVQRFFEETIKACNGPKPTLGFLVAGYSTGGSLAESWVIEVKDGQVKEPTRIIFQEPNKKPGKESKKADGKGPKDSEGKESNTTDQNPAVPYCLAYGQSEPVYRLLHGYSKRIMLEVLKERGVTGEENVNGWLEDIRKHSSHGLIHPAMPIQDAIELAEFLANVAVQVVRFAPGAPSVGGPIDIAAITKHEGFKWVQRKHYFKRRLNPPNNP